MFQYLSSICRVTFAKTNVSYMHFTNVQYAEHKMMRKIMMNEKKKKHKYVERPLLLPPAELSKGSFEGKRSGNSRRVNVLNKLFMRYITDLVSSGEHSSELFGRGIEISQVRVTPDYKAVHVYWICSDVGKERDVETKLKSIAGDLRTELANLHVVGLIPKIIFFKDTDYSKILRIDDRLSMADFGDDHEPLQYKNTLKTALKLEMKLDESTKWEISKLENEIIDGDAEEPLPEMPQKVLGLDHSAILNTVLKGMKTPEINDTITAYHISQSVNESPIRFSNIRAQNDAFKEFLVKRKILEAKAKQENRKYEADLRHIYEELSSCCSNNDIISEERDATLDDFIDDEK